jgi:hypothetical protein
MDTSPIVVDIETAGLLNAADYLEPVTPDARLKDPDKIAADIESKTQARLEKLGLDWNVGRIVALGSWTEDGELRADASYTEEHEAAVLAGFWDRARHRTIVGFNVKGFDLKFMVQRSRYLGIAYPDLELGRYGRSSITDLYQMLTFGDGTYDQGAMRRTLGAFCRRFGIPVTDTISGKDVGALVAAGEWASVLAHVTSDVTLTLALARRLGVVKAEQPEGVVF